MPVVASSIVMALVIAFWWSQKESHDAQANRSLELHADATEREIRTGVNTRVQALVRMARRWEQRGGISQTHWERNAAQVYADMPGFQAIGLVDADYVVRWIVPLAGNEAAIDLDLSFEERRRQALNQARQKQVPTMTQSIDLVQGGKGFIVYVPLYVESEFQGFISGVFRFNTLIGDRLVGDQPGLLIQEGESQLYGEAGSGKTATRQLNIHGNTWEVEVASIEPDESAQLQRNVVMTIGVLLALLMGTAVRLSQTARLRAEYAERATLELRKHECDLLTARDAAEEASRVKSEFLANMSHEIRTPMNGVLGFTELLLGTAVTPTQEEYLRVVQTSADSLLTVINDILDFSQIEAGKLRLHAAPFSLRDTLMSTTAIFGNHARQKSLNLRCNLPDDLPAAVLGDGDRLRQILVNLIGNAIKFTESGSVTIGAEAQLTDTHIDLSIAVHDTGLGIDDEQMARIFEAFAQVDGSLTRAFSGTGLGLAISQNLAEMMGGKIAVESTMGEGSTFRLELGFPVVEATQTVAPVQLAHASVSAKTTIVLPPDRTPSALVAEDNPINQMLTCSLLRLYNISVEVAENGAEALERWREGEFDLILMDVQLPQLNGLDVTRQIREFEAQNGGHVPIIALTARAMKGDREECLASGMDDYLAKPFPREQLQSILIGHFGAQLSCTTANEEQSTAAGRDLSAMHGSFDDLSLLRRMVNAFLDDTPRQIQELTDGIERADSQSVAEFAHLMHGSCLALELKELAGSADALEICAKHDISKARPHLDHLVADFANLQARLQGWLAATAP